MSRSHSVTFAGESFTFDLELVNGADAWDFLAATGQDLVDALADLVRCQEQQEPLAFHVAVVARWLAERQSGAPEVPFRQVAAATVLPFPKAEGE